MSSRSRRSRNPVSYTPFSPNLIIALSKKPPEEDNESKGNIRNILKNLKLTVNKLHIRFEDDYFSNGENKLWEPFSLGLVIDRFEMSTGDNEWQFDSPLSFDIKHQRP
jgi:hypothetical protein